MVCPRCGLDNERIDPRARFCGACGTSLLPSIRPAPGQAKPALRVARREAAGEVPSAWRARHTPYLLLLGCLVVALAAAARWANQRGEPIAAPGSPYSVPDPPSLIMPPPGRSPVAPYRVAGALEGEQLRSVRVQGCLPAIRTMDPATGARWSGGQDLWCVFPRPHGSVTFPVEAAHSATYDVWAYLSAAPDAGIAAASLDGRRLGAPADTYSEVLAQTGRIELGRVALKAGTHTMRLEVVGRSGRSNGWTLGIDCVGVQPARPVAQHPIDLSARYNFWRAYDVSKVDEFLKHALNAQPRGLQMLDGTRFRIGGVVQLGSQKHESYGAHFPRQVTGIRVGRACRRLHFLHCSGWKTTDGAHVGDYVVHYADGRRATIPIVYGEDVRDWLDDAGPVSRGKEVWRGYDRLYPSGMIRLFKSTWVNPRPGVPVRSLDYVSTWQWSGPFMLAATAE